VIPQRSRERSASSRHSRSIASLSSSDPSGRGPRRGPRGPPDEVAPLGPPGGLDGRREALLGCRLLAAQERDGAERAEEEGAEVVGEVRAGEGEGGLGLGLGAVRVAPLEARPGRRVEEAGPLLGRADRPELPFRAVEEGAGGLHVAAAEADHPDLEREERGVPADRGGVGVGARPELLQEEVVGREGPPPVARAEVDVAEPLADRRLLRGAPGDVEELEDAAVRLRRLVVAKRRSACSAEPSPRRTARPASLPRRAWRAAAARRSERCARRSSK